jgi:hypothetical protein
MTNDERRALLHKRRSSGECRLRRRPTTIGDTYWALPVIASEAKQSTVPLPPTHRLGHASSAPAAGP